MMQYSGGGGNICDTCGRGYRWSTGLSRHKRLECGKEAQFQCPHCTYRAKQKVNLFAHIRRKHPSDVPTNVTPKLRLIAPICHLLNWQNYLNILKYLCMSQEPLKICLSIYFEVTKWLYEDYSDLSFNSSGCKGNKTCSLVLLELVQLYTVLLI